MAKRTVRNMLASAGFKTADPDVVGEIEEALGKPLPAPLRDLFLYTSDEYLGGHSFMRVFAVDELVDVLGQTGLTKDLPGYLYFASDDGDGFYALTPPGSVVRVDRGAAKPAHVAACAPDVETFVQRTLAGENWLGAKPAPEPQEMSVASAIANAAASTPATYHELYEAGVRCNVRLLSSELAKLYETSNGLIAGAVTIRPIESVEPVAGVTIPNTSGRSGAVWFADDARGARYAFVTSNLEVLRKNEIVRVASAAAFEDGERLGLLGKVLSGWLRGPEATAKSAAKPTSAANKRPIKTRRRSPSR